MSFSLLPVTLLHLARHQQGLLPFRLICLLFACGNLPSFALNHVCLFIFPTHLLSFVALFEKMRRFIPQLSNLLRGLPASTTFLAKCNVANSSTSALQLPASKVSPMKYQHRLLSLRVKCYKCDPFFPLSLTQLRENLKLRLSLRTFPPQKT